MHRSSESTALWTLHISTIVEIMIRFNPQGNTLTKTIAKITDFCHCKCNKNIFYNIINPNHALCA